MTYQKHIIKRQVIELQIPSTLNRIDVQNHVSRIFHDRLLPLIDKYLTKESPPSSVDKIEILELDLGVLNMNNLEQGFIEKIESELKSKLSIIDEKSETIAANKSLAEVNLSDLDLVVYFLQNGSFPWWVSETSSAVFEKAFSNVLKKNGVRLKNVFNRLLTKEIVLDRLCLNCNEKQFSGLIEIYLPCKMDAIQDLHTELGLTGNSDIDFKLVGRTLWKFLLKASINQEVMSGSADTETVSEMLLGIINQKRSLQNLAGKIEYNERLFTLLRQIFNLKKQPDSKVGLKDLPEYLQQIQEFILKLSDQNSGTKKSVQDEFIILKSSAGEIQNVLRNGKWDGTEKVLKLLNEIQKVLLKNGESFSTAEEIENLQNCMKQVSASVAILKKQKWQSKQLNKYDAKRPNAGDKELYNQFSQSDKVYIQNAGLVLLWPFLNRFFQNLQLANTEAFTDEAAAEKACLILQYLTQGSTENMFEALLPLNKVLCGIELQQPLDTQLTMTEEEMEASENFLEAIIMNAPMWKGLSTENLRLAYLKREGALSARDGNWLLQVKRETYDILVDKLPWSIQIVKLPWMKNLIFVEW